VEVVLGIDIGTSSTKGLLVTTEGQVVQTAQRAHQLSLPRPLGAEGLLVPPYLAGERTPASIPTHAGLVAGLTLRHNRAHLFRAAYEGIAFGIRPSSIFLRSQRRM
jgi:xylulokinase